MNIEDLQIYYAEIDAKVAAASSDRKPDKKQRKGAKKWLAENYPAYPHIGPYVKPTDAKLRDLLIEAVERDLKEYRFDFLVDAPLKSTKYNPTCFSSGCKCKLREKEKARPVKQSSHRDKVLYAAWNSYITKHYVEWRDRNRLQSVIAAYIPNAEGEQKWNSYNHAKLAFDYLVERKEYHVVALDVKSFFDEIPHIILEKNLKTIIGAESRLSRVDFKIFRAATCYSNLDKIELERLREELDGSHYCLMERSGQNFGILGTANLIKFNGCRRNHNHTAECGKGVPQGLPCSGSLANIAMMDLDIELQARAIALDGLYMRYADDLFLAAPNRAAASELKRCAERLLREMHLPIATQKTECWSYEGPASGTPKVSYLGLCLEGKNISLRGNTLNKFYDKTRRWIYSYILGRRRVKKKWSKKKVRGVFSHSGKRNSYSYARRFRKLFEEDNRYDVVDLLAQVQSMDSWIDRIISHASTTPVRKKGRKYELIDHCKCTAQLSEEAYATEYAIFYGGEPRVPCHL